MRFKQLQRLAYASLQILKRIRAEIERRRAAGEELPPPPKTAIAGPEYFGLNQPEIVTAIEALDPHKKCAEYWEGKAMRAAAMQGMLPLQQSRRGAFGGGGSR